MNDYTNLRVNKIREYLIDIIDELNGNTNSQINVDMLSNKINDYSIDKVPVEVETKTWILGTTVNREVYLLRSRKLYSQNKINNLKNIGFFEEFENKIKYNNYNKIFPEIKNIESIKCLNCGAMNYADTTTAEFSIQIQITYREEANGEESDSEESI